MTASIHPIRPCPPAPMACDVPDVFAGFEATHAARRAAYERFHGIDTPDPAPPPIRWMHGRWLNKRRIDWLAGVVLYGAACWLGGVMSAVAVL